MRFLGVGETCDLGALYIALQNEGHEVRVHVSNPLAKGTLAGLVPHAKDWRAELDWVGTGAGGGIILFESVSEGFGALQDDLRAQGYAVIGGSTYGDRLENDRAFAQQVFAELGFPGGHVWEFSSVPDALTFLAEKPARYVIKYSGPDHASHDTYIGQLADARDVIAILRARVAEDDGPVRLILMQFVEGVEMGIGAYFDGDRFLTPACLDWEHKRFFAGDLGELTGEMGTVVTYADTDHFFRLTLAKMEGRLRANGYVGYINLNTIVNERGIWPLEFTCRFGYPGYAILAPLQETGWGELFGMMATRSSATFRTRPGFALGIVVTTPPFPYTREEVSAPVGLPLVFTAEADPADYHLGEAGLDAAGQLVTSGLYGWTLVVTGTGATITDARREAYAHVGEVFVPSMRYRLDIGERLIAGDMAKLMNFGVFGTGTDTAVVAAPSSV